MSGCSPRRGGVVGRALLAALLGSAALGGCLVRYVTGPRLTGTCTGACDHYVDCRGRPDQGGAIRRACVAECPAVLGNEEALMAFESLSCPDTVEFVEGRGRHPPGPRPSPTATTSSSD